MYADRDVMIARFGEEELIQITDREGAGAIDDAALEAALADAAGEIDGYAAAGGYPTPLDPVPRIVLAYACDIARYRLYDVAASDQVTRRYDDAIRFLKALASGTVTLGAKDEAPASSSGAAQFEAARRIFGGGGF